MRSHRSFKAASPTGCLRKKPCISKRRVGRNKRHLHGVLFAPFFGFFHFRSLSGLSPTNSSRKRVSWRRLSFLFSKSRRSDPLHNFLAPGT